MRRGEPHDIERAELRVGRHEQRRQDREIFGDVVGDREGRQRAARHQELLADLDDLDEFRRVGIEVDHVAGLARGLRAGLHGDADVGLGERGRVVRAVAAHGDEAAAGLFLADIGELVLGRRLGEEIVDAGFGGDGRGGDRIVARDHHRADAHGAQRGETLLDAGLHHVLEMDDAEQARTVSADRQRRAARRRDLRDRLPELGGGRLRRQPRWRSTASTAPLRIERPAMSTPESPRLRGEGHDLVVAGIEATARRGRYSLLASATMERPSGVSSARLDSERGVGEIVEADARRPAGTRSPCGCRR